MANCYLFNVKEVFDLVTLTVTFDLLFKITICSLLAHCWCFDIKDLLCNQFLNLLIVIFDLLFKTVKFIMFISQNHMECQIDRNSINKRALQLIRELFNWIRELSNLVGELFNWIRELCNKNYAIGELSNWISKLTNWIKELSNWIRELSIELESSLIEHFLDLKWIIERSNWISELSN